MKIFSKELYELDRNTVQYMIDEMQDTIDEMQNTIGTQKDALTERYQTIRELQEEHEKSLSGTVSILRRLSVPEQEIILQICEQYQIGEEEVRKYL